MIDVKWLEAANCVIKRIGEQLDTARTDSAAWKASAHFNRVEQRKLHEYNWQLAAEVEAAEQRVAEIEEALQDISNTDGYYMDSGYAAVGKAKAALNK